MSYDPEDHTVTARQALAGWIVCIGVVGLAFAATEGRHAIPVATANDPIQAKAIMGHCAMSGIRLPSSAACIAKREEDAVRLAQGPMSLPAGHCG
jgi:hypothetical protein